MIDIDVSKQFTNLYNSNATSIEKKERSKQYRFIRWVDRSYLNGRARMLLDAGCGNGGLDFLLSKKYEVTGIDIDKKAISAAKKKVKKAKFLIGDMRKFSTKDGYDIIISVCAIDHGHELRAGFQKLLKNLNNLLNDGGLLIFDLNFMREFWMQNSISITTLKNGRVTYKRIYHRKVKERDGIFYYVTTMIKGDIKTSETNPIHKSVRLLDLKTIKNTSAKAGFDIFLYDGWRNKITKNVGKTAPVCVLIKTKRYE